ncbi:MAG: phosphoadenylyl-sulfate reductase [Bryobacteraceae bacterium]
MDRPFPIPDDAPAEEILRWAIATFGKSLAVSTSFQAEGMVIVDMASRISGDIRVFTLDTGRLPEETYQMMETVRDRYGISVEPVFPDAGEVESMAGRYGPNLFYREAPLRMLCCHIRKSRPLERKLAGLKAWVTGLRRAQNESREGVLKIDSDAEPVKISPLADWSPQQVDEYVRRHDVPLHPLYSQGYTSIGCAPCTRAVKTGEGERAGRWWWELEADKECGIHFSPDGRAERTVDVLLREVLAKS